jgi:hypothetical protein
MTTMNSRAFIRPATTLVAAVTLSVAVLTAFVALGYGMVTMSPRVSQAASLLAVPLGAIIGFWPIARTYPRHVLLLAILYIPVMAILLINCALAIAPFFGGP